MCPDVMSNATIRHANNLGCWHHQRQSPQPHNTALFLQCRLGVHLRGH